QLFPVRADRPVEMGPGTKGLVTGEILQVNGSTGFSFNSSSSPAGCTKITFCTAVESSPADGAFAREGGAQPAANSRAITNHPILCKLWVMQQPSSTGSRNKEQSETHVLQLLFAVRGKGQPFQKDHIFSRGNIHPPRGCGLDGLSRRDGDTGQRIQLLLPHLLLLFQIPDGQAGPLVSQSNRALPDILQSETEGHPLAPPVRRWKRSGSGAAPPLKQSPPSPQRRGHREDPAGRWLNPWGDCTRSPSPPVRSGGVLGIK